MKSRRNHLKHMIDEHPEPCSLRQKEMTVKEIGKKLGIAHSVVLFHEKNALKKLWVLKDDPEFQRLLEAACG